MLAPVPPVLVPAPVLVLAPPAPPVPPSGPGAQTPAWQVPTEHGSPSLLAGAEQSPVAVSHVPASWHSSIAGQLFASAPTQAPLSQASVWLHASPSSQADPSAFAGSEQTPVAGSHVPTSWHWSCAVHATGSAPAQLPAWQLSLCVQALPSSHAVPSALFGLAHTPVAGSHVPASWHPSCAAQVTGFDPVHAPAWQVSLWVHASASSHALPSALLGFEHTPVAGSHVPGSWHPSCAAQITGFEPVHAPAWQVSLCVHASASSHAGPVSSAHVPSEAAPAAIEQASQVPASHAVLQQTPSAQNALAHSEPAAQASPLALFIRVNT